jgi:hypothetical protein
MSLDPITTSLKSGQLARLIPSLADSKREERATSVLLATFMVVPTFAQKVLQMAGAPIWKRSKIICFTEIEFGQNENKKPRPDGLIVIKSGKKTWSAIVESKIGPAELKRDQIEEYLDLAKSHNIDALITISNQFATLPTHHPVQISKSKTKHVSLYHFSWLSIESEAILLCENKAVNDLEQAFILNELVRYLQHAESGVTSLTSMGTGWKEVCSQIQHRAVIKRSDSYLHEVIGSWHQLLRFLSIRLSIAVGKPVHVYLSRTRQIDPILNFEHDVSSIIKDNQLYAEFEIPNASSNLSFTADFSRRTIDLSMTLEAPKDRSRATASINWFTRQLNHHKDSDLTVSAYWPRRIPKTTQPLRIVLDDPSTLIPENVKDLPKSFEVLSVVDLAGKFKGSKTFVEEAIKVLPEYYASVGQHLNTWIPKPPQIKAEQNKKVVDSVESAEIVNPFWIPPVTQTE